ncbi:MAG: hypothetical protein JNM17_13345 [Archangium sp.]|nr:hypothetical protein [Archangium sp.]
MKRMLGIIAAGALAATSAMGGVAKGDTLFIKNRVKMSKDPKAGSAGVGAELAVGSEVKWLGPSEKDKTFHEIEVGGKKGFVLMSNLTPNKPAPEISDKGGPLDTKAFASSGAATKGLTNAALKYSEGAPNLELAAVQVIYTEEHNKNKQNDKALEAKAKELGGGK